MKVLLSWLHDYVEFTGTADDLASILTEVGLAVTAVTPLGSGDAILELDVTSNRGDCLSHVGVSREVAAAMGQTCRTVIQPVAPEVEGPEQANDLLSVTVEATDLCPAYGARVLLSQDIARPTPAWIQRRLSRLGQRLVNPVVDITNFLLLARGQPLHAFDRSRLIGHRIIVRRSRAGESIETLDGRTRKLPEGLLIIADAERPVAVAGVMGGRDTEVGPGTVDVVVESARFRSSAVRASCAALGLTSEASARFSRRIDPEEMIRSLDRAVALMTDACGGRAAAGRVLAGPEAATVRPLREVALRFARIGRILGKDLAPVEACAVLRSLAFDEKRRDSVSVTVAIPSHREDITSEIDLIEEIARVRGYGELPTRLTLPAQPVKRSREARVGARCRTALVTAGCHEALTLPFVAPGLPDDCSPWTDAPALRVLNPVRMEEPLLRRSLLGPLIRSLERNRARGVDGVRLFELSRVFLGVNGDARPEERVVLSGIVQGSFSDVRGVVDALFATLHLDDSSRWEKSEVAVPPFARGRMARIEIQGAVLGWVGEVDGLHLAALGVHHEGLRASAFELDFNVLLQRSNIDPPVVPVPTHPQSIRDIAIVLSAGIPWSSVQQTVRRSAGELLRECSAFDEYRGRGIPEGGRSIAFRMVLGAGDRTLTGHEIDQVVATVVAALSREHAAVLRGQG